jgi:hypothetical protein
MMGYLLSFFVVGVISNTTTTLISQKVQPQSTSSNNNPLKKGRQESSFLPPLFSLQEGDEEKRKDICGVGKLLGCVWGHRKKLSKRVRRNRICRNVLRDFFESRFEVPREVFGKIDGR